MQEHEGSTSQEPRAQECGSQDSELHLSVLAVAMPTLANNLFSGVTDSAFPVSPRLYKACI